MRILELFCGLGGAAVVLAPRGEIVAAIDLSPSALAVYRHNFPDHETLVRLLEGMPAADLAAFAADLWWLSPPCQPFTVRGRRRDADDPRARPFLAVIDRLEEIRPTYVALENVPGFRGSRVHAKLRETLGRAGYGAIEERVLCPSELGLPNRRRRYYLVASRRSLGPLDLPTSPRRRSLRSFLDPDPGEKLSAELTVDRELLERYHGALHIVDADDPKAVTNCFTSAYGRSPVRSGSYLRLGETVRRFSPREILRLLDFPETYELPPELPTAKAWALVGNSLSLAAMRRMLSAVPDMAYGLNDSP